MHKLNRKGQSIIEYAVVITIVLGSLLAIGLYMKRGLQGRWKAVVDDLGDQYDPSVAQTGVRHLILSNTKTDITTEEISSGFWTTRTDQTNTEEKKFGWIQVGPPE